MGHLHTCPLHLKLMPATSLSHISYIMRKQENRFDYIFYSQSCAAKQIAPKG